MNIFVLDHDPKLAAQYQADKHVVKMILESTQLLCTAHRVLDGGPRTTILTESGRKKKVYPHPDENLYQASHVNHPCSIWVRQSEWNYQWLLDHAHALVQEYRHRYGKAHACLSMLLAVKHTPLNMFGDGPTPFVLAMPDEYKSSDPVQSYREYYIRDKYPKGILSWNKTRPMPEWMKARVVYENAMDGNRQRE